MLPLSFTRIHKKIHQNNEKIHAKYDPYTMREYIKYHDMNTKFQSRDTVKDTKKRMDVLIQKEATVKSFNINELADNHSHDTSILTVDTDIPYNPANGFSTSISESTLQMIDDAVGNTINGVDGVVFDLNQYKKLIEDTDENIK